VRLAICALGGVADDAKPARQPKLALHVGKIITCAGEPIINGTILISNGKIEAVGRGPRSRCRRLHRD
jgi:imidazolonepropionase-like amidohydrolase